MQAAKVFALHALAAATSPAVSGFDELDPELLYLGIEEEEEEEDPDDEPEDPEEDDDGDRGDDLDPDLPPEEDDGADDEPDDDAPDDEPEPGDEPAEQPASAKKPAAVPHARFNQVNEDYKTERAARLALEERLARLEGTKPAEPAPAKEEPAAFDFDAAEDRYTEALLEGDTATAKTLRAEIRKEERAAYIAEAQSSAKATVAEDRAAQAVVQQQNAVAQALTSAVTKYPFLNHESDDADVDAIEDVVARRDMYVAQGMSVADAINKAVTVLAKRFKWDGEPEPVQEGKKPAISADKLKRNIERSKQVPERLPGVGGRNTNIDYEKLGEDDFANLSAKEKAIARGDVVKGG